MKVSVVVPTYNRANLVTETIDSILGQTFDDFELILVDNLSTDNTEEVIRAQIDKRLRYFKNQNNGIMAANRNYGIGKAQGEYIAFCDDDDLWLPEKLERQLLDFEKDDQIGLVCSNIIDFDKNGEHGHVFSSYIKDSAFTFTSLIMGNPICTSSVLVRKRVIDDVGMMDTSPEIRGAEDYELWLRIAKKYRVKYIGTPLVKYRIHPKSYTQTRTEIMAPNRAVYGKLLEQGILDAPLYHRRMKRLRKEIFVLKLLTGLRILQYLRPLSRLACRLREKRQEIKNHPARQNRGI